MKNLYVVYGVTGEYSDRSEWNVAAFETLEEAKEYINALTIEVQQIPQSVKDEYYDANFSKYVTLDPNFTMDYTGTSYHYAVVPFLTKTEMEENINNSVKNVIDKIKNIE